MDNNVGMAQRYEHEIPEGYEARIEGNKVILERRKSEGERIRKNCIHFLELQKAHHADTSEIDECIAYLEKEKVQNLTPKFKVGDRIYDKKDSYNRNVIREVGKDYYINGFAQKMDMAYIDANFEFLEHLDDGPASNKPAVWSEEDTFILDDAITAVDLLGNDAEYSKTHPNLAKAFRVAKDFLKSLPERFNLQPKQEWSEEDNRRFRQVIDVLDRNGGYILLAGWLKSLPRRITLQPHWKPSDEQMWALDVALENFYHKDDRAALESLRTDLKNYFSHEIH